MEYISEGILEMTGYSSNDLIENKVCSYNSIIVDEDKLMVFEKIHKRIKNKEPYTIEYRISTRNMQQKWVWERGRGVFDNDNLIALEGFISDISDLKNAEIEKNKLINIIENSINEIYIFDAKTYQFKYLNQGALNNLGYNLSEIMELTPIDIKPDYNKSSFEKMLEPLKIGKIKMLTFETKHQRKNGTTYPVKVYLHLSKQGDDNVYLAVINDITEQKKYEELLIKNEQRYTDLVNNMSEGIYQSTPDGKFLFVNPAMAKMFGYQSVEEMLAIDIKKELYFKPEDRGNTYPTIGNDKHTELVLKKKDGSPIWVADSGWYIKNEQGEVMRHEGILYNITEKKKAEEALVRSEEHYRILFNCSPIGIMVSDTNGNIERINPILLKMLGSPNEEETKKINLLNFKPLVEAGLSDLLRNTIINKQPNFSETAYQTKWGKSIFLLTYFNPILDTVGNLVNIQIIVQDISERKLAESTLIESEKKYRLLFENAIEGIYQTTLEGKYLNINPAFAKMFGYQSPNEMMSSVSDIGQQLYAHPKDRDYFKQQLLDHGFIKNFEAEVIKKDGQHFWILINANLVKNNKGEVLYIEGTNIDITEIKKAKQELQSSEEKYRNIFSFAPLGIYISTREGTFLSANKRLAEMLGYETLDELLQKNMGKDIYWNNKEREALILKYDPIGFIYNLEIQWKRKNNTPIWISLNTHQVRDEQNKFLYFEGFVQDITYRKDAENKLKENNERLELAMKTANMAWWEMDIFTGNVIFEKRQAEMLGYDPEIFKHYTDFTKLLHPDDYPKAMLAMRNHLEGKIDRYEVEYRILTKQGDFKWFYDIGTIVKKDLDGKPKKITGLVINISERKQAEDKIKSAHDRLRRFIDSNIVGVIIAKAEGKIIESNDYYLNLIGYTREELEANKVDWRNITPSEWLKSDEKAIIELKERGNCEPYEKEYLRRDGTRVSVLLVDAMLPGPEEQIAGFILDITQQKLAEKKSQIVAKEWQETFNSVSDAIWIMGTDAKVIRCNKASEKLLGLAESEMKNRYCWEIMHHTNQPIKECPVLCLQKSHKREIFEMKEKNRWLEVTVDPIFDENNQLTGIVHIISDITERKQMEEAIKHINEELEHRVKIRTTQLEASYNEMEAFTYSVSHDLRAPLRAIDGFSKMLLQDYSDIDPEAVRLLNVISQSSSNMGKLIEDLLSFSRVGRANITTIPISMKEMVQSIVTQIKKEINCKHTEIKIGDLADVMGDKTLLNQVWTNLIRNAIKFSFKKEQPIIEIGCLKEQNEMIYYIKDNGVGFDMKYVDKLFGVFQRLHSSDEFEGTGIGLAIVKKAIGRHGGRVWAESVEGEGASFYFALPINK